MILTPKHLEFDESAAVDAFHIRLYKNSDSSLLVQGRFTPNTAPLSGPADGNGHNVLTLAGSPFDPAMQPLVPLDTDVKFTVQAEGNGDVSTEVASSVFQFHQTQAVPDPTNVVLT